MESRATEIMLDHVRNRYYGKYRGIVRDNQDSTKRGRVKVVVPSVTGEELEQWAMPCLPYTGKGVGSYFIPEVEAGVWVEFEAGDASFPIWTGGYWTKDELPENEEGSTVQPEEKILRSAKGLLMRLDDNEETISVSDSDGSNILKIISQEGQVKITGKVKVIVEAPQIELVANASHPLVYGDNLLNFLNQMIQIYQTHTHPGELALGVLPVTPAPPMPPMPFATPALLSQKVKTG
jgi:uncharacterized protein involved in type VI secretion and phage assembly